nr:MAG TPA: hypothetical protein [Caudoviricetes sp.]DAY11502.1 MAG TPA: hypothetical protein [Caudoviricetes sp.]
MFLSSKKQAYNKNSIVMSYLLLSEGNSKKIGSQ